MRRNLTKSKLRSGEPVFGMFVPIDSPVVVELCGLAGFDFCVIDGEHGPITPASCYPMVLAAEARGTTPILRVPGSHAHEILPYLDLGAQGIQVPQVESAGEVRQVVLSAKYHPIGMRGLSMPRAGEYGLGTTGPAYVERANEETLVVVQIESRAGLERLDEVLAVESVDVVFIGPSDLSQSFGVPFQVKDEQVVRAMEGAVARIQAAGKIAGIFAGDVESARFYLNRGVKYIAGGVTDVFAKTLSGYVSELRAL